MLEAKSQHLQRTVTLQDGGRHVWATTTDSFKLKYLCGGIKIKLKFNLMPKLKFNSFSVQTQGIFCRLQNIYIYIPKCWRAQLLLPTFQNSLNTTRKLTANLTFAYKKQYTAPRREYTVSELIFSSSNCCHSPKQVNEPRTPMIYPSVRHSLPLSSRILRGCWYLPTNSKLCHGKLGDVPAPDILGTNGGEQAERGFHGVCGAIIVDHPIAV